MNYISSVALQNGTPRNQRAITSEQYYQYGWARIGHMMHPLGRACRLRDMQLAGRILQELKQEWEGQDAWAKTSGIEKIMHHHRKVNCLRTLTLLISEMMTEGVTSQRYQRILSEIKNIDKRLETMVFQLTSMKKKEDVTTTII